MDEDVDIVEVEYMKGTMKKKKKNCKICKKILFEINLKDLTLSYTNKYFSKDPKKTYVPSQIEKFNPKLSGEEFFSDYEFGFSIKFIHKNYFNYFYCKSEFRYKNWVKYISLLLEKSKEKEEDKANSNKELQDALRLMTEESILSPDMNEELENAAKAKQRIIKNFIDNGFEDAWNIQGTSNLSNLKGAITDTLKKKDYSTNLKVLEAVVDELNNVFEEKEQKSSDRKFRDKIKLAELSDKGRYLGTGIVSQIVTIPNATNLNTSMDLPDKFDREIIGGPKSNVHPFNIYHANENENERIDFDPENDLKGAKNLTNVKKNENKPEPSNFPQVKPQNNQVVNQSSNTAKGEAKNPMFDSLKREIMLQMKSNKSVSIVDVPLDSGVISKEHQHQIDKEIEDIVGNERGPRFGSAKINKAQLEGELKKRYRYNPNTEDMNFLQEVYIRDKDRHIYDNNDNYLHAYVGHIDFDRKADSSDDYLGDVYNKIKVSSTVNPTKNIKIDIKSEKLSLGNTAAKKESHKSEDIDLSNLDINQKRGLYDNFTKINEDINNLMIEFGATDERKEV